MGVERTPNKSQHTKLTLEKKILLLIQSVTKGSCYLFQTFISDRGAIDFQDAVPDLERFQLWAQVQPEQGQKPFYAIKSSKLMY